MARGMDAANEGPPVLIHPNLSITAVIIYCLHLPYHTSVHTHTHTPESHVLTHRHPPPAFLSIHPSLTPPTLYFLDNKVKDAGIDLFSTAQISLGAAALKEYSYIF